MRITNDVVCRGCGSPAANTVNERGEVTYEASKRVKEATVQPDGSIAIVVARYHDGDDFYSHFDSHGFFCSKCDMWGRDVLDVVERDVVPEVGDRYWLKRERRNGVVERVLTRRDVTEFGDPLRIVAVEIEGERYDFRDEEELEVIEPHPQQITFPIGGNA